MRRLRRFMLQCSTIRRTEATSWLDGKSVIICPRTISTRVHCPLKSEHIVDYRQLCRTSFRSLSKGKGFNKPELNARMKKIRVGATWPGLIRKFLSPHSRETGNALPSITRGHYKTTAELAATSPKFKHFVEKQMPKWKAEYAREKHAKGELLKVLFFSLNPYTAAMWGLALQEKYGKKSTVLYLSTTSKNERACFGAMFDNIPSKYNLWNGNKEHRDHKRLAQFFSSTYGIAGVGLNLRGAHKVVLVEPSFHYKDEEQAICRSARTGQTHELEIIRCTSTKEETELRDNNNTVEKLKDYMTKWIGHEPGDEQKQDDAEQSISDDHASDSEDYYRDADRDWDF